MSQGLRTVQPHDLAAELEAQLLSRLAVLLRSRSRGHCMRLVDLDSALMARLCARLRTEVPEAQVVILGNGHAITPSELTVSATKLVELRNPVWTEPSAHLFLFLFLTRYELPPKIVLACQRLKKSLLETSIISFVAASLRNFLRRSRVQLPKAYVDWKATIHGPLPILWPSLGFSLLQS